MDNRLIHLLDPATLFARCRSDFTHDVEICLTSISVVWTSSGGFAPSSTIVAVSPTVMKRLNASVLLLRSCRHPIHDREEYSRNNEGQMQYHKPSNARFVDRRADRD